MAKPLELFDAYGRVRIPSAEEIEAAELSQEQQIRLNILIASLAKEQDAVEGERAAQAMLTAAVADLDATRAAKNALYPAKSYYQIWKSDVQGR